MARQLLESTRIRELIQPRALVHCDADTSVREALQLLAANSITSAPVLDKSRNVCIGLVDTIDLVMFIMRTYLESHARHPHLFEPAELQARFSMPVRHIMNLSERDPFVSVDADATVKDTMKSVFSKPIHRVVVVDRSGKTEIEGGPKAADAPLIGIVSQSDVVAFLWNTLTTLEPLLHESLTRFFQLGLLGNTKALVAMSSSATLAEALYKLITNNVTGIAIVDANSGKLLNNLSASDLKGITEHNFYKLEGTLDDLFTERKLPPVTAMGRDSFGTLLERFATTGVHRVYVVDEAARPEAVISLTDVIRVVVTRLG